MRNCLLKLPAGAAGLVIANTAGAAAAALGNAAAALGNTAPAARGGKTAAEPGTVTRAPQASTPTVLLVNGDQIMAATAGIDRGSVVVMPAHSGRSAPLLTLGAGGTTYEIPAAAVPFVGKNLGLSLFNISDLLRAERGGRVPVWVAYRGRRPALPGVTLTRAGGGMASGYLTASSARVFGAALARQAAADHARGSYGQDGMFAGGVTISLAGTAPAPGRAASLILPARTGPVRHTLTIHGTNLSGGPDTGGGVVVANVDNTRRFAEFAVFHHGTATMKVPAGHYWAAGVFSNYTRMVVVPQFTVTRDVTMGVDERTATSKITVATPRPAQTVVMTYNVLRSGRAGSNDFAEIESPGKRHTTLYVNPTSRRPTIGKLAALTSWVRLSPPGVKGTPYRYYLERLDNGRIRRNQHYVVRPASLATVRARFYSDIPGTGFTTVTGVPSSLAKESMAFDLGAYPVSLPGRQTQYFTAGTPPIVWYEYEQSGNSADGQNGPYREFRPGQVTEDWGAFPLHPAPNRNLVGAVAHGPDLAPSLVSASRSGDTLSLDVSPFSDSAGDTGFRFSGLNDPGAKVTGSYEIDENGKKIASGNAVGTAHMLGDFYVTAALGPEPSSIRLTLDASVMGTLYPLSTATHTVWTWRSSRQPDATVPRGWACRWVSAAPHLRGRNCAVQPMMTLGYRIAGLGLDGAAKAGPQSIRLTVGHLQLAAAARITSVTAQVSFDDGKTWQTATVTGSAGAYRAAFTAVAGSYVTLRVTAASAAGGKISETIIRAYKITS